ncbi:type II toxin-antitoxin system HicB family antitoxin [Moraxella sp. ZY200743]|uniref:type II toxin-antitoxin system HicB family antitoxin n=1 Tax=Moraxella sp. ZY200743 TaxID=2911970 RepID=UPI003D7DFA1C
MYYPATFTDDDGTLLVRFRDIPEAITCGDDVDDAMTQAVDCLESAFVFYMDKRLPIPAPSELQDGEHAIYLPVSVQTKLALYDEMLKQGITKAELARRLSVNQKQIDRLWDLTHSSKLEMLEKAFSAIGKRLQLAI